MKDITMCTNTDCQKRNFCYRGIEAEGGVGVSYAYFQFSVDRFGREYCDYFFPIHNNLQTLETGLDKS